MDNHPRHQNLKEITELCLGLPGAAAPSVTRTKRVFADTQDHSLDDGDFKLKLQSKPPANSSHQPLIALLSPSNKPSPPKAQVVGWPPVRAHRQNAMKSQKQINVATVAEETSLGGGGALVKLSIDGAPYLRKVDLKMYKSYQELSDALAKLFSSFTKGSDGEDGMIDFMNESKSKDALNSSDFVKTYQDKDGDWMLVGDVPWEMFVNSCNRLRIMKKSEAKGLGNLRISNPMEKSS